MSDLILEIKEVENEYFGKYQWLRDWSQRINSSQEKAEPLKINLDVSEVRKNWNNYPNGVIQFPVTINEVEFRAEITKINNKCPFGTDIIKLSFKEETFDDNVINIQCDYIEL